MVFAITAVMTSFEDGEWYKKPFFYVSSLVSLLLAIISNPQYVNLRQNEISIQEVAIGIVFLIPIIKMHLDGKSNRFTLLMGCALVLQGLLFVAVVAEMFNLHFTIIME